MKDVERYFEKIKLPNISESISGYLNRETEKEEIIGAIGMMKNGKVPGPYGLSAIYYKILKEELTSILIRFNERDNRFKE